MGEGSDAPLGQPPGKRLRLGVLLSGGGRTLENLIERIHAGTLPARIEVVISSHPQAHGVERAKRHGITVEIVDWRATGDRFSEIITERLDSAQVDLVVMAGFIRRWRFPERYRLRVMNIHPALLPAFGGHGFYGEKVHQAVISGRSTVSGCTVHFADDEYDHGPIILQRAISVLPEDTPHSLAERVFAEECIAYPEAIRLFAEGRIEVRGGRALVKGQEGEARAAGGRA